MNAISVEAILRRDRAVILGAVVIVAILAWTHVIWLASSMDGEAAASDMSAMGGMEMSDMAAPAAHAWSPAEFAIMFAMWSVMMIGMMLPSVTPMLLIYAGVARHAGSQGKPFASTAWFAGGYLLAWIGFSLLATIAQWMLESTLQLSPMTGLGTVLGGGVLIAAGVYQWTLLKDTCLSACQSPLEFIVRHGGFRRDVPGALGLGVRHGLYCIGCCWALMAILFAVGIMNLLWVAAIAIFVLLERIVPAGRLLSRVAGAALVIAGTSLLI